MVYQPKVRRNNKICQFFQEPFRNRNDLNHESLEATWFELLMPKSKPIMIGTVYRPPDKNNFVENFEEVLFKIRSDIEGYYFRRFQYLRQKKNPFII